MLRLRRAGPTAASSPTASMIVATASRREVATAGFSSAIAIATPDPSEPRTRTRLASAGAASPGGEIVQR
jgi:hypothetical protein